LLVRAPFTFDLSNRVVLITGASSGLGAHFARIVSASGAKVVLAARRADRITALASELELAGGHALAIEMDVSDEASVQKAFDAAEHRFGSIDSVIANAGMNVQGSALELPIEEFDRLIAVNVRGVFLTVREGARRMLANGAKERAHGRVVIISSLAATKVEAGIAVYSASKAAVRQLGKTLARDWVTQGINVNSVCPGYIETELNSEWFKTERGAKQIARMPRKRLQSEGSLDAMVLYLSSDASAEVTGTAFDIDDGQLLG
jgi:NAD(P)-dependent dehydrogenase (short-subunit alcohol dehydrogenase family)